MTPAGVNTVWRLGTWETGARNRKHDSAVVRAEVKKIMFLDPRKLKTSDDRLDIQTALSE